MIHAAEIRYRAGNPPGKDNKLGDAINWECLMATVPNGEDLFFISADRDYSSVIDDSKFNLFLREEWHQNKGSNIIFFKSLVSFLKAHFKDIQLQAEQEKDDLIIALSQSRCFATTHAVIKQLSAYSDWSKRQIEDLFSAAIGNYQVLWILTDEDVAGFYNELLSNVKVFTEDGAKVKALLDPQREMQDSDDGWGELPF